MKIDYNSNVEKLEYIDILRGVAIILVVWLHSYHRITNPSVIISFLSNVGAFGVQLFFVTSALTLCLSTENRGNGSFIDFYIRRFFRIAPLYYFGIIFYFVWGIFKSYFSTGSIVIPGIYNVRSIVENLLFIHGLDPLYYNKIVPGGWSISTEMLFYFIFPQIYLLQRKLSTVNVIRLSVVVLLTCLIFQKIVFEYSHLFFADKEVGELIRENRGFGYVYCSIINQLPVFMVGIATYRCLDAELPKYSILFALITLLIAISLMNAEQLKTDFNGLFSPFFAACFFGVMAIYLSQSSISKNVIIELTKSVGRLSFSIYIVHFFVLDIVLFFLKYASIYLNQSPSIHLSIIFSLALFMSYILSIYLNKYIEIPGISAGRIIIKTKYKFI